MSEKVKVRICVGTYSYVMGGAELLDIGKRLPEALKDKVEISGINDIEGLNEKRMNPPFAMVNNRVIIQATDEKIIQAIEKELVEV